MRPTQISINVNLSMPAIETAGVEGRWAATEATRRKFYELMSRECTLLLESIAASCHLTNANVNFHEQRPHQSPPLAQISVSGSYAVVLKTN